MTAPRTQRLEDAEQALITAFAGHQAGIWTALPAIVSKVNLAAMTLEANVTIQIKIRNVDQSYSWVTIPPCVDVPILFPGGGGYTLTFPIAAGDECLLLFSSRCIDSWWQLGGVQVPPEIRMHTLSDGFALVGPRSQPRVLSPQALASGVELRSDDHAAYVQITGHNINAYAAGNINATAGGDANVVAGGTLTLAANSVVINGPLTVNGNVNTTGTLINNSKSVGSTHKHSGVVSGGSNSGNPI